MNAWITALLDQLGLSKKARKRLYIKKERDAMSKQLWWIIMKRDNYRCRVCGATASVRPLHVDHIVPLAKGGKTEASNLQVLCERCNLGKGIDLM